MPPFTPILRITAQRQATRQFSIISRVRSIARTVEPHPYERLPIAQKVARADWGKQARHLGDAAIFYFPAFAILLGWPLLAEKLVDGHVA